MPASYRVDHENKLVRSTGTGALTDGDLRSHLDQLTHDPAFQPSYRQLWDLREVKELEVTCTGLREMVAATPWREPTQRAIVASSEVVFGMSRMVELLAGEHPPAIRVFRRMPEALEWLDLD